MRRKAVTRRLKAAARLHSFILATRDRLDRSLSRRPAAPDGCSYRPVFDHLLAELVAVERRLGEGEDAYDLARLQLSERRQSRLSAQVELHTRESRIRRFVRATSLYRGGVELRAAGSTPKGGTALVMQVRGTLELLRMLERHSDPDAVIILDPAVLAGELETVLDKFRSEDARLDDARFAANSRRAKADEAIAEYDRVVPWVARGFESYCQLAGEEELADRVRRIARR